MKRTLIVVVTLGAILAAGTVALAAIRGGNDNPADTAAQDPNLPGKLHRAVKLPDGDWRLRGYKNTTGTTCLAQDIPQGGTGTTCGEPARLLNGHDIYANFGGRQLDSQLGWDNLFVYGYVSQRVQSLDLVNLDCSVSRVPYDEDGAFMYVAGQDAIAKGVEPYRLVARDRGGQIIEERVVKTGLPANAIAAGRPNPVASSECA